MEAADLSPILAKKRTINNDFAAKETANTFSRTLSQQRGTRQRADFTQGFQRQVPTFAASYGNRGLANSGVYQRAMQQFTGDYTRDLGRMWENSASDMNNLDMERAGYTNARDQQLADLELQKAQMIASTAMNINALRPLMG